MAIDDSLSIDALKAKAAALAEEINATKPELSIVYAIHHTGHLRSTLHMMEDVILEHPAGHLATPIINRPYPVFEPSAFHGLLTTNPGIMGVFKRSQDYLAIISINIDQYNSYLDALRDLYSKTWLTLETLYTYQTHDIAEQFNNRPIILKRSRLDENRTSMCAEAFSILMMSSEGYEDISEYVSKKLAYESISRRAASDPINTPFLLISQIIHYAITDIMEGLDNDRARIDKCEDITYEINEATSDEQIRQWWRFAEPAQDMAWRGYKPEQILNAAIFTSEDPFVRSITHKVAEYSNITPSENNNVKLRYNPFIDIQRNIATHHALIQESFDGALAKSAEIESSNPMIIEADHQNNQLLQGQFIGWCANALQASARAFDQAQEQGRQPAQAAKLEFEALRMGPSVENLKKVSNEIIRRLRRNEVVMLEDIPKLAENFPDMAPLAASVKMTSAMQREKEERSQEFTDDLDFVLSSAAPKLTRVFAATLEITNEPSSTPHIIPSSPVFIPQQAPQMALSPLLDTRRPSPFMPKTEKLDTKDQTLLDQAAKNMSLELETEFTAAKKPNDEK